MKNSIRKIRFAAALFLAGFLSVGLVTLVATRPGEAQVTDKKEFSPVDKNYSFVNEDDQHYINPNLPARPPAPQGIVGPHGEHLERATFAGGCFWCMETPFEKIPGVKSVTSGYTGGTYHAPSYRAVSYHKTDQMEAIDIIFDPQKVSYEKLLDIYWRQIDPTDNKGQFVDRGNQYRPFIWVHNEAQRKAAIASKKALAASQRFDKPIVVPIVDAVTFWPAEDYHQDFYKKDPVRYHSYRSHSGRDPFLKKYWGSGGGHGAAK